VWAGLQARRSGILDLANVVHSTPTERPSALRRFTRWRVPLGFLCSGVALWLARPTGTSLAWGGAIAILGEAIRVWAAGHLEKSREVTTSGPYRFSRHPLYVGSTVMAAGVAVAARHPAVWAIVVLYVVVMIGSAIRSEEAFLRARFGGDYDAYRAGRLRDGARRFSLERALRNREWRAVVGVGLGFVLLWAKLLTSP
jgi:protein-S-isoprenylcysteine O-methyltransferase Ste14